MLLAAALTLTACVSAPPLAADPDTAAYLAQGTLQAASTLQARKLLVEHAQQAADESGEEA